MTTINLTNQTQKLNTAKPYLQGFIEELVKRKPIWDKLSYSQKKAIIQEDKDKILKWGWLMYKELREFYDVKVDL